MPHRRPASFLSAGTRRLSLVMALGLLGAVSATAQSGDPSLPVDPNQPTAAPEVLASFDRLDGARIVFGVGATDDDLGYLEAVPSGGVLTFPAAADMTLLDRYLAISPANQPVPRLLVLDDPRGSSKIGTRQIVEAVGHHQLDLPIGDEGSMPIWECGSRNTQANFEAAFCNGVVLGPDGVQYCDSQLWWVNVRQNYRRVASSVTGYCGGVDPLFGAGGLFIESEWINGAWVDQDVAPFGHNLTLFTFSATGSPTWKRLRREVFDSAGVYWGSFRAQAHFRN